MKERRCIRIEPMTAAKVAVEAARRAKQINDRNPSLFPALIGGITFFFLLPALLLAMINPFQDRPQGDPYIAVATDIMNNDTISVNVTMLRAVDLYLDKDISKKTQQSITDRIWKYYLYKERHTYDRESEVACEKDHDREVTTNTVKSCYKTNKVSVENVVMKSQEESLNMIKSDYNLTDKQVQEVKDFITFYNNAFNITEDNGEGYELLPIAASVMKLKPDIEEAMKKYQIPQKYLELILAQVMQESGGNGKDPFQSSESLCGSIGCITDPKQSIEQGMKRWKEIMDFMKQNGIAESSEQILQQYNYGDGFGSFVKENGGAYSMELAHQFSVKLCGRFGTSPPGVNKDDPSACYGDFHYVDHVMRYVKKVKGTSGSGNAPAIPNSEFKFPIENYACTYTAGFGTYAPFGKVSYHYGEDLAAPTGTPVMAVMDGEVVATASDNGFNYGAGNFVRIRHNYKGQIIYTVYMHASKVTVRAGQHVKAGDKIMEIGTTGNTEGPHLHFEVRLGEAQTTAVDPAQYVPGKMCKN